MVANLGEFKTYLAEFLWKDDDTVLIARLNTLVKMATSELDRKLDISRREVQVDLTVDANPLDITDAAGNNIQDFQHLKTLLYQGLPLIAGSRDQVVTPSTRTVLGEFYYLSNKQFYFQIGDTALPLADPVKMLYRAALPTLSADTDTSYVLDDYLDLYTYTTLKHCSPFLREDERVALWAQLADRALQDILSEQQHSVEWGGVPSIPLPKAWNP